MLKEYTYDEEDFYDEESGTYEELPEQDHYLCAGEDAQKMVESICQNRDNKSQFDLFNQVTEYQVRASYVAESFYEDTFLLSIKTRGLSQLMENVSKKYHEVLPVFLELGIRIGKDTPNGVEVLIHNKLEFYCIPDSIETILGENGINEDNCPDYHFLAGFLYRPENIKKLQLIAVHHLMLESNLF